MCKHSRGRSFAFLFCFLIICRIQYARSGADVPPLPQAAAAAPDAWSSAAVERAEKKVAHVQALVGQGALPQSDLAKAQAKLADAEDEETLAKTLYSGRSAQDMTMEESHAMMAAARRRVDRQVKFVENQRAFRKKGLLPRSKLTASENELAARRRVLQLADERAKKVQEIAAMADVEGADAEQTGVEPLLTPEIRYDGYGHFKVRELGGIRRAYYKKFHQRLPVTAIGETRLHRRMGLDHRGRVDVGLDPDCPQGVWLRHYLEKRHIPYLAFRCAIRGAATAPHIHIGPESTRLKLVRHRHHRRRHSGSTRRVEALR